MSSASDHNRDKRSDYNAPPEFKATIPQHMLERLPVEERFFVESLNRLESQFKWAQESILRLEDREIDERRRIESTETELIVVRQQLHALQEQKVKVDSLWDWKNNFSGKWAVLVLIAVAALTFLFGVLRDVLMKLLVHT